MGKTYLSAFYRAILMAAVILPAVVLLALAQSPPTEPPPVNTAGVSVLVSRDQLQIRSIQLALAHAHIARLQAEAQIKAYEGQLSQTVEDLKVQYSCQTCTLNADFTWTKPEPPKAPAPATTAPAQKDGQNSKKE